MLEVGLGGRLDAVNVVDADVAVVVSVALDHMEWLGPDLESIGREKAGIFRRARPAVCGMAEPTPVRCSAWRRKWVQRCCCRVGISTLTEHADGRWDFRDGHGVLARLPAPALEGVAQTGNAATALAALRQLAADCRSTVRRSSLGSPRSGCAGRFQRVPGAGGIEWVLDVAHNPAAAATLAANLARHPVRGRTVAVCGMLDDKDVGGVLSRIARPHRSLVRRDRPRGRGASVTRRWRLGPAASASR